MGWFKRQGKKVTDRITSAHKQGAKVIRTDLSSIRNSDKQLRSPQARAKRDAIHKEMSDDFDAVKKHWGFSEHQIPRIIRGLTIESGVYCAIAVVGAISIGLGLERGFIYLLAGMALMIIGGTHATILIWKRQVINNRQFITLKAWVLGRTR